MPARRHRRTIVAGTLGLALLATTTAGTARAADSGATAEPAAAPIRLQSGGGFFRDAHGRVVILHGFNVNGSAFPDTDAKQADGFPAGDALTTKDADFLVANGFNFIRLGVDWSKLVPRRPDQPGWFAVDQDALSRIVRVADLLASRHIYFMIDFHGGCWLEWPAWAVPWDRGAADVTATPTGQATDVFPFPVCYFAPGGGNSRAYDNLWKDPDPDNPALPGGSLASIPVWEVWKDHAEAWRQVAAQFRDTDYLMGYDFINEPGTGEFASCDVPTTGCPHAEERIQAFEQNALAGVRSADPVAGKTSRQTARAAFGVFEPPSVSGTSGAATGFGNSAVDDPKVVWSFHVYCGNFAQPVPGTRTCASLTAPAFDGTAGLGGSTRNAAHLTGADRPSQFPGRDPAPQLMSEFGSAPDPTVTDDTLVHADPLFISWAYWQYRSYSDWDIGLFADPDDEACVCFNAPSPRADVLIRPYAQATAGTPWAYAFDTPTHTLTYTYRPAGDPTLTTDVVVPAYYAPRGYNVDVVNGHVVSPPGALHLEIRAASAGNVTVTVTPK